MKYNYTVQGLRKEGFKVGVRHHIGELEGVEYERVKKDVGDFAAQNGKGFTEISLTPPRSSRTFSYIAVCGPKDQYNKKIGVRVALNRLIKNIGMDFLQESGEMDFLQKSGES